MISMGKQTVCAPRVLGPGLPQTNSSLFEPAALVYLRRQYRKSDSYDRCAWLGGRVELMVMHGEVQNNYEHNVVVMNLPLCQKTADGVILIHVVQTSK